MASPLPSPIPQLTAHAVVSAEGTKELIRLTFTRLPADATRHRPALRARSVSAVDACCGESRKRVYDPRRIRRLLRHTRRIPRHCFLRPWLSVDSTRLHASREMFTFRSAKPTIRRRRRQTTPEVKAQ